MPSRVGPAMPFRLPSHLAALHAQGISLLRQGRVQEAEAPLRRVLAQHPEHVPALVPLGDCLRLLGRSAEAEALYSRALRHQPDAAVYNNLGMVQRVQGKLEEAVASYRQAITLAPTLAAAHTNLGATLARLGRPQEAEVCCREALRLDRNNPGVNTNLGIILQGEGKLEEASPFLERALELQRHSSQSYQALGRLRHQQGRYAEEIALLQSSLVLRPLDPQAWHELGIAQYLRGETDAAIDSLRKAISQNPNDAAAYADLGIALDQRGDAEEAEANCRRAITLDPALGAAYTGLVALLTAQNRIEEALQVATTVQEIQPDNPMHVGNLAALLGRQEKDAEALAILGPALDRFPDDPACNTALAIIEGKQGRLLESQHRLERVIAHCPDHEMAHKVLSDFYLRQGDFARGWIEYEWLLRGRGRAVVFPQPRWNGEPLEGKTILVWAEFGLGDTIQFMRYLPLVKARGARVAFVHFPELTLLLQGFPGYDLLVPFMGKQTVLPVAFDLHIPLMGLPRVFQTDIDSIPANVPYLAADPQKQQLWRERLAPAHGYRVGMVWAGNPRFALDLQRSLPLSACAPLCRIPGIHLYSLQKGAGAAQLAAAPDGMDLTDLGSDLHDLTDTAAAITNLDLVITVDTSVAHLAGALGKPVWNLLPFHSDWRWLQDREDSPWYPTMRLFRQPAPGDWSSVIVAVGRELQAEQSRRGDSTARRD